MREKNLLKIWLASVNFSPVREATVHKMGQKYQHEWMYLQSIKSVKHLPQVSLQVNFKENPDT